MKIALFPNTQKKATLNLAQGIAEYLQQEGVELFAEEEVAAKIGAKNCTREQMASLDFLISLGGDGTILQLAHLYPEITAPILGINMGGLGFMADTPIGDVYRGLQDLLKGKYQIEKRIIVEGQTQFGQKFFAVNDVVLHRAKNPSIVDIAIYVDSVYLNTFSADGVIIATPNGSTAYSLAAGGPILSPALDALVITPICPHTISNRPIVLKPKHEIRLEYLSDKEPVELTYDGIAHFTLSKGQSCHLYPSNRTFSLVNLSHTDYFATLRSKLGWAGTLRA